MVTGNASATRASGPPAGELRRRKRHRGSGGCDACRRARSRCHEPLRRIVVHLARAACALFAPDRSEAEAPRRSQAATIDADQRQKPQSSSKSTITRSMPRCYDRIASGSPGNRDQMQLWEHRTVRTDEARHRSAIRSSSRMPWLWSLRACGASVRITRSARWICSCGTPSRWRWRGSRSRPSAATYRRPGIRTLLWTWIVAVPVGLIVRTIWVGSPSGLRLLAFLGIGLAFTLLFLLVGRAVGRRRRPPDARAPDAPNVVRWCHERAERRGSHRRGSRRDLRRGRGPAAAAG